jgi:hypothetical protein
LEELDKSATASCKKTPGPTKRRRKKTVYKGKPSIVCLCKSSKLKTVCVCMFPRKPAETLPGREERKNGLRLEMQASMQKDWQWRREGLRLGGALSGWLELELKLTVGTVLSEISTATIGAEKMIKVVEGGDIQEVPDHQQVAEMGRVLEEGGGQGEGGETQSWWSSEGR